jgi:hypothetical protein
MRVGGEAKGGDGIGDGIAGVSGDGVGDDRPALQADRSRRMNRVKLERIGP